ncbi:MAG TPA: DNA polymerase, partial [Armatimonadota bacterium]|nr:DNA polymerase [Armatimonadota bacterium]
LRYKEETLDAARRQGYVSTLLGRRRALPEICSRNRNFRELAERVAVNTPIQGTAADIIKLAMLRVDEHLRAEHPGTHMLLQVHDELLFESPVSDVERLAEHVRDGMETALDPYVKLQVRLRVAVSRGPNWAEMQPIR